MVTAKNDVFIFYWVELTFGGEGGMSKFLAGVGGLPSFRSRETLYIYIYIQYIYIQYIYIYIYKYYTYYTYTYIKELCQQAFIYNEEGPCTLYTS